MPQMRRASFLISATGDEVLSAQYLRARLRAIAARPGILAAAQWHDRGTRGRVPVVEYTPRNPSASAICAVVREHDEGFLAEATPAREGQGLPRFVEDEFRAFLRCGFLAGGFRAVAVRGLHDQAARGVLV